MDSRIIRKQRSCVFLTGTELPFGVTGSSNEKCILTIELNCCSTHPHNDTYRVSIIVIMARAVSPSLALST